MGGIQQEGPYGMSVLLLKPDLLLQVPNAQMECGGWQCLDQLVGKELIVPASCGRGRKCSWRSCLGFRFRFFRNSPRRFYNRQDLGARGLSKLNQGNRMDLLRQRARQESQLG